MVERPRNLFIEEEEDPPPAPDVQTHPPPPPHDKPDPGFAWNAEVALETGRLIDKLIGHVKDPNLWQGLKAGRALFMKGQDVPHQAPADPAPPSTNGAAPDSTQEVSLVPAIDMNKVMAAAQEAVRLLALVKGRHPISELPTMFEENRDQIKTELQKAIASAHVYQEAPRVAASS